MTTKSLWGNIENAKTLRTPTLILKEQASLLGKLTSGVLEGDVRRTRHSSTNEFLISLYIVSSALDSYRLKVLEVRHDIGLYPAEVYDELNERNYIAIGEPEFLSVLERILSSDKIRGAVSILISESNADILESDAF